MSKYLRPNGRCYTTHFIEDHYDKIVSMITDEYKTWPEVSKELGYPGKHESLRYGFAKIEIAKGKKLISGKSAKAAMLKDKFRALIRDGNDFKETCEQFGIHIQTGYTWTAGMRDVMFRNRVPKYSPRLERDPDAIPPSMKVPEDIRQIIRGKWV